MELSCADPWVAWVHVVSEVQVLMSAADEHQCRRRHLCDDTGEGSDLNTMLETLRCVPVRHKIHLCGALANRRRSLASIDRWPDLEKTDREVWAPHYCARRPGRHPFERTGHSTHHCSTDTPVRPILLPSSKWQWHESETVAATDHGSGTRCQLTVGVLAGLQRGAVWSSWLFSARTPNAGGWRALSTPMPDGDTDGGQEPKADKIWTGVLEIAQLFRRTHHKKADRIISASKIPLVRICVTDEAHYKVEWYLAKGLRHRRRQQIRTSKFRGGNEVSSSADVLCWARAQNVPKDHLRVFW